MPRGVKTERHGMRYSPEYAIWSAMITRCYNPNFKQAKDYSERGIVICDGWRHSFATFYRDMGPRPSTEYSIERINNNGIYEPGNCKWATKLEQNLNKRSNVIMEFNGKKQSVVQWAKELGLRKDTLFMRLHRGWSVEKTLTQPLRKVRRPNG